MPDGVSGPVRIDPVESARVRGTADGLGPVAGDLVRDRTEVLSARRNGAIGMVHSWELVTAVDGPGTRLTLFLTGCPLRCKYCHNPDTMALRNGTEETAENIISRIRRYHGVFHATGGGLTISGGEPLFQVEFTRRLLKATHDAGIHTAIDTSGFLGSRLSDDDLENVDLVLLDVKSGLPSVYRETTARELAPTLDFGDRLHRLGKRIWIRFVLVPGLTDDPANVEAVADIVSTWAESIDRVEVLPFHNMGADKWHDLGMNYELDGVSPPTPEATEAVREVFRSRGLTVH